MEYDLFNQKLSLYENKNNYKKLDDTIHESIHNNIQTMQDDDTAFEIFRKIVTPEKLKKELLTYDLLNYNPSTKINNEDELIKFMQDTLAKYQYIVGGFDLEDDKWFYVDDTTTHRFRLENKKILYNTLEKQSSETEWFLLSIQTYMQKHTDIKIHLKIKEDEKNCIIWVLFFI
jgi:hypothetical protein